MARKMKSLFSEGEQTMLATLGVYGCWLLMHAKQLPDCGEVRLLIASYSCYRKRPQDNDYAFDVIKAIDKVIKELKWEDVKESYPIAIQELKDARKSDTSSPPKV